MVGLIVNERTPTCPTKNKNRPGSAAYLIVTFGSSAPQRHFFAHWPLSSHCTTKVPWLHLQREAFSILTDRKIHGNTNKVPLQVTRNPPLQLNPRAHIRRATATLQSPVNLGSDDVTHCLYEFSLTYSVHSTRSLARVLKTNIIPE